MSLDSSKNKNFFILANALEKVGNYPQHQTMNTDREEYDYQAPDSVHKMHPDKFLEFPPNFKSIYLPETTILTDRISSAPIPWYVMIVSKKLLTILKSFKLPPHRTYAVTILHGQKAVDEYFAIHILIPREYIDAVDFSKSSFWLTTTIKKEKVEKLQINTAKDLEKKQSNYSDDFKYLIRSDYFSLRNEFLEAIDLFALPGGGAFPAKFFVSSGLRESIESEFCSGLRFIERHNWEQRHSILPQWSCLLQLN